MKKLTSNIKEDSAWLHYADPLRVLAVLAVISLHASAVRVVHLPEVHTTAWWTAHAIDSLCRWAVPVFVMLSGALNLDVAKKDPLAQFYSKRFLRVVIPLLFWASAYFYWSAAFYRMDVSSDFIKSSLWSGLTYNHLYFLFIIIGLYVVTPLLKAGLRSLPVFCVWAAVAVLIYLTSSGIFFWWEMNALTRFSPYIMFYLLGHLLRHNPCKKNWAWVYGLGFLAASAVIIGWTYFLVEQYGRDDYRAFVMYDHFNVFVILQSLFMFLFMQASFRTEPGGVIGKIIKTIAPVSFGVYLLHVIFLDVFRGYTASLNSQWTLLIIALEVAVVYAVSVILALGIARIPYVRRVTGG